MTNNPAYIKKPGDVLIDNLTLLLADEYLNYPLSKGQYNLQPLASFVESVVLFERVVVDPLRPSINNPAGGLGVYIQGYSQAHSERTNRVLQLLPSEMVAYVDLPVSKKVEIIFEIEDIFGGFVFHWEKLASELSKVQKRYDFEFQRYDLSALKELEAYPIFNTILNATKDERVETKKNALYYLRSSGDLVKHAYYAGLSRLIGVPYSPNYHRALIFKLLQVSQNNPDFANDLAQKGYSYWFKNIYTIQERIIQEFQSTVISSIDKDLEKILPWEGTAVRIPPVFARVLSMARKKKCSVLEAALSYRVESRTTAFRKWCRDIDEAYQSADRKELKQLLTGFTKECKQWMREDKDYSRYSQFTITLFNMIGFSVNLPDPLQTLGDTITNAGSKHILFLRDLI
jgi:hypothetical protein